ncbi:MAG: T9SS type A sorting domain-containing protein [Cytophagaceae bacterium]
MRILKKFGPFTGFLKNTYIAFLFVYSLILTNASAAVVISNPPATVYPCTTFPTAYVSLGNIVITEGGNTDFGNGAAQAGVTLILQAPANFEFQPGVGSVSFTAGNNITAASIGVTATQITVTFSNCFGGGCGAAIDVMTISGIKVRGITAITSSSQITRNGGTAVINGSVGFPYGTLISSPFPSANAGADQLICTNSSTFAATAITDPNITGTWTLVSGTGAITTPGSATSGVTGLTQPGDNVFKWTIVDGACTSSSNVTISTQTAGLGCTALTNQFSAVTAITPSMALQNITCPENIANITTFTLANPGPFNVGDKVLIIQMQGATVSLTDSATNDNSKPVFGSITSYSGAGNYEYSYIATKVGSTVTFSQNLINAYNPAGSVQLVTVPQFANLTVTGVKTGTPWNSTTKTGGVMVFEVLGTLTLNGAKIEMDSSGFLGGGNVIRPGAPTKGGAAPDSKLNFGVFGGIAGFGVYSTNNINTPSTGVRGEGIAGGAVNLRYGRGALANGGGSGGGWNSGAGGGSNICAGGRGGYEFSQQYTACGVNPKFTGCVPVYAAGNGTATGQPARMHGIGGYPLTAGANQVFMGGGGGAGNGDGGDATPGGNGGGIIIITAPTIAGTSGTISANAGRGVANNIAPFSGTVDATGAGGGGGSIILDVTNYTIGSLTVRANGGKGGNQDQPNTCHGNGGGGGGGLVRTRGVTPNVTISALGGNIGVQRPSPNTNPATDASLPLSNDNSCAGGTTYGAVPGTSCTGSAQTVAAAGQAVPQKGCCSPADLGPDQTICGQTSITLSNGTLSNTNKTFKWYKNGILIAGATNPTLVVNPAAAGTYSVVVDSVVAGFDYCSVTDAMIMTTAFPTPYLGPNQQLCNPAFINLSPSNVATFPAATTWQWTLNGSNITGETTAYLNNVTAAGTYTLTATAGACGPTSASITLTTTQPVVVDGCRNGCGTVSLSVSGGNGGTYDWYANQTGGSPLAGGTATSSFTTPSICATTTYWVKDNGLYQATIGPSLAQANAGSFGGTANIATIDVFFDLTQSINLLGLTAEYFANTCAGSVTYTITITNPGTGYNQTRTGTAGPCGPGTQTYTFTFATPFVIPAGTGYDINITGNKVPVSYSGFTYPSTWSSFLKINSTTNSSSASSSYPSLFDWQVSYDMGCGRVPVVAEVGGSCAALPVSLVNFSGRANLSNVFLTWNTTSESNNDYFLIQRSVDGEHYENIGKVAGNGTSSSTNSYSLTDNNPPFEVVYYRLVQVDKNGRGTTSNSIAVNNIKGSMVSVYPNPFENGTNVVLKSGYNHKVNLRIFDMRGEIFYSANGIESNGTITVGQTLPDGVYVLEVRTEEGVQTFRIVKLGK